MSEQNDETADGCEMLTATSDPVVLYQALCRATDEIEQLKRERDEAQEIECAAIESWWEENQRALREGQRVVEAGEQSAKLRDIADRAIVVASMVSELYQQGYRPESLDQLCAELDQLKEGKE